MYTKIIDNNIKGPLQIMSSKLKHGKVFFLKLSIINDVVMFK